MGAYEFENEVRGTDLKKSFDKAVANAQWESGHGGYTGTIAEKFEVELHATVDSWLEAHIFAEKEMAEMDHDKWGPAWAVKVTQKGQEGFLFYGYASS